VLNHDGELEPLELQDLTPSSARLEQAIWRKQRNQIRRDTSETVYDIQEHDARPPTRAEKNLIGKMFEDVDGRWIVRAVQYSQELRVMLVYYEKLCESASGQWIPAMEVEYSSVPEVCDWIAKSSVSGSSTSNNDEG
jgi:hypothetical protein